MSDPTPASDRRPAPAPAPGLDPGPTAPSAEQAAPAAPLRTGWTTGTCASAAAKAATIWLATGSPPDEVEVALPSGRRVRFAVADVDPAVPHRCAVVKDAGDDPDVTDGAHVTAAVAWGPAEQDEPVVLVAGEGVGTVTRPGLGLDVGAPAVNPVPRRMIRQAVGEVAEVAGRPVVCTLSVPGGEAMAARTTNPRLGIVGGISILGTTGIVRPFSTASFRASVRQQVAVAAAGGASEVVLATGSRTEAWALRHRPDLDPVAVVLAGDFLGAALRRAEHAGLRRATIVGMAGKVAKLAGGAFFTHERASRLDPAVLVAAAEAGGGPHAAALAAEAAGTLTARGFAEACVARGTLEPLAVLCRQAAEACAGHVGGRLDVEVVLVDFAGEAEWARARAGAESAGPGTAPPGPDGAGAARPAGTGDRLDG